MHTDQRAQLREIASGIAKDLPSGTKGDLKIYDVDAFLCPNCWVRQGAKSQLYWVDREEVGDRLRCDACHAEFVV
ncbi:MAG: hypothetical protein ACM3MH_04700 [Actinomycetota bacterium]